MIVTRSKKAVDLVPMTQQTGTLPPTVQRVEHLETMIVMRMTKSQVQVLVLVGLVQVVVEWLIEYTMLIP